MPFMPKDENAKTFGGRYIWKDSDVLAAIRSGDASWSDFDEVEYQSALFAPVETIELLPHYEFRVHELAKMMGARSKEVLRAFRAMGRNVRSASSKIEIEEMEYEAFVAYFNEGWVRVS